MSATVCPYCRAGFEEGEEVQVCPSCDTPHHADCFAENGGCTVFGCASAPADDPKISVTPTDLHTPAPAYPPHPAATGSIYNLRPPVSGATPPPPPMPSSSGVLPPPMQAGTMAGGFYPPAGAGFPPPAYPYLLNMPRPKSRVVFVLLAVFFGALGAHNFYAGYNKKAVIQLCLSVFTCFYGSFVSWIWAIVEACTVSMDDDGVPLT